MTDISTKTVSSAAGFWRDNGYGGLADMLLALRAALDAADATIAALTAANAALAADNARMVKRVEDAHRIMDRGLWLTDDAPAARAWFAGGAA
jgi:hypothetical protein